MSNVDEIDVRRAIALAGGDAAYLKLNDLARHKIIDICRSIRRSDEAAGYELRKRLKVKGRIG